MKTLSLIATQFVLSSACLAQIQIVGYEQGGQLTFQGGAISNYFTMEYATSLTGPWTNWGSLTGQAITGSVMVAAGPMFFRITSTDNQAFPPNLPLSQVWTSMHQGETNYQGVRWFDFNDPTNEQGAEYTPLRLTVKPSSSSTKLLVEFHVHIGSPDALGQGAGVFVFKDSDARPLFGAVREDGYGYGTSGHTETAGVISGSFLMNAGASTPIDLRVYVACRNGSTVKLNSTFYGNYGNKLTSTLRVTEIR